MTNPDTFIPQPEAQEDQNLIIQEEDIDKKNPDGQWLTAKKEIVDKGKIIKMIRMRELSSDGHTKWDWGKKTIHDAENSDRILNEHGKDHGGPNEGKEWKKDVEYYDDVKEAKKHFSEHEKETAEKYLEQLGDRVASISITSGQTLEQASQDPKELKGHTFRELKMWTADGDFIGEVKTFYDEDGKPSGLYGNAEDPYFRGLPNSIEFDGKSFSYEDCAITRFERKPVDMESGSLSQGQEIEATYFGMLPDSNEEIKLFRRVTEVGKKGSLNNPHEFEDFRN